MSHLNPFIQNLVYIPYYVWVGTQKEENKVMSQDLPSMIDTLTTLAEMENDEGKAQTYVYVYHAYFHVYCIRKHLLTCCLVLKRFPIVPSSFEQSYELKRESYGPTYWGSQGFSFQLQSIRVQGFPPWLRNEVERGEVPLCVCAPSSLHPPYSFLN